MKNAHNKSRLQGRFAPGRPALPAALTQGIMELYSAITFFLEFLKK
jgi:hypothetical protein